MIRENYFGCCSRIKLNKQQKEIKMELSDQNNQFSFHLQRSYLKDLSLEMPHAPQILLEKDSKPQMEININVGGQALSKDLLESRVSATITAYSKDKTIYLIEATQAGIFKLVEMPVEHMQTLLHITCPTILYPYLRSNIADLTVRTSLPPFHLADVNFHYLYKKKLMKN